MTAEEIYKLEYERFKDVEITLGVYAKKHRSDIRRTVYAIDYEKERVWFKHWEWGFMNQKEPSVTDPMKSCTLHYFRKHMEKVDG